MAEQNSTHAQRMLVVIEAAMEGRASTAESELELDGMRIKYMDLVQLMTVRDKYRAEVKREQLAAKFKDGGAPVRFGGPSVRLRF